MSKKYTIYTTELDYQSGAECIEEEAKELESILKELAEKSWLGGVLASKCKKEIEQEKIEESYRMSEQWLDDERANLDEETGEIVVIADLGLWSGRVGGVKSTGKYNLNAILENHGGVDDFEVFVEGGEVKGNGYHHDGTNHYIFREVIDEEKWGVLAEKIANGEEWSEKELNKATKSLANRVCKVYGWQE